MSTKKSKATKKTNTKKPVVKKTSAKKATIKRAAVRKPKCAAPNKPLGFIVLIILGVAGLVLASFLIIYTIIGSRGTDASRFAAEYSNVSKDNAFVYRTGDEIVDILEHGTGVVFLGFPSCPWCQAYAGYLSEIANEKGLDTISYYNIEDDRSNNTELYQKLVSILTPYLQYDDAGQRRIYVPNVTFVVDGKIIGNDLESSKYTAGETDPANYWTEARVSDLKARLGSLIQTVIDAESCKDSCNK
ncbi:hypothetical protein J6D24_02755 [Candidatus Saccharibacteria bacterium]|nr:hypothetical protein [Candidatus Saccharibacteria bacterium]